MSAHTPVWRRRRFGSVLAVVLAGMATAASTVSAQGVRAHAPAADRAAVAGGRVAHAAAVPAAAGQVLGGLTSQGWPVVIEVSKNGKKLMLVRTGLDMTCTSGLRYPQADGWVRLPVSANGKVHAAFTFPPQAGSSASLTGGTDTFSGKFNRKQSTLTGVWQLRLNYSMSNGQTDQCDSGRVAFSTRL